MTSRKSAITSGERLTPEAKAREAFILALRMTDGVYRDQYKNKYGAFYEQMLLDILESFPKHLYEITDRNIKLTTKGMRVANRIWLELI